MDPPKPEGPSKLVLRVWLSGPSVCFGLIFYRCFTIICKNVLLAAVGSTFLKSGPQHFTSKKTFFGPPSGKKMRHFGHFRPP